MGVASWFPLVCLFSVVSCSTSNNTTKPVITADLLMEMGGQHKAFALLHLLGKAFQNLEANLDRQLREKEAEMFYGDFPGNGTFATLVCSVLDCSPWSEWPKCDPAAARFGVVTRSRQCRASSPLCSYGNGNEPKTDVQEKICTEEDEIIYTPPVVCPSTFTMVRGFCLKYVSDTMYQSAAQDYCEDFDNGHLIHVDSQDKRDALHDVLNTNNVGGSRVVWLNGKRQVARGDFQYSHGNQSPSFNNWCSGEPSKGSNELCEVSEGSTTRCRWDRNCDNNYSFVCEIPM